MKKRIALTALAILALAAPAILPNAALAQSPIYSAQNLGMLAPGSELDTVTAMSSDGARVVGSAETINRSSATTNAFYWDGTMHNLYAMRGSSGLLLADAPIGVTPTGLVVLGTPQPEVWTLAGGAVPLPSPVSQMIPSQYCAATSVNDDDVVVGTSANPDVFLVSHGTQVNMRIGLRWSMDGSGSWTYQELQPLPGDNTSFVGPGVNAIDQNGNIFGRSWLYYLDANGNIVYTAPHCVRWSPSDGFTPHDLGAFNSTLIAFDTDPTTLATQFLWNYPAHAQAFYAYPTTANTIQLFGSNTTSPSAQAQGLNMLGQVAGNANFTGGSHAFYRDTTFPSGAVMDLGVLTGMTVSTVALLAGRAMNIIDDGGFIVGDSGAATKSGSISKAFLSTPASRATSARLLDLNGLLTANALKNAGLSSLTQGMIINDAGFIACHGVDAKTGYQRIVILTRVQ